MKKLLAITNMYPDLESPYYGIFVKEQLDAIEKLDIFQIDLYYINAKKNGKFEYIKSIFNITKIINNNKYDVIHIHYGISALFLLFVKPKCKIFLTLHGADISMKQKKYFQIFITKRLLKKVDKVFVLNNEMVNVVKKFTNNYSILPCGINTDFFKPYSEKTVNKNKIILFPGDPNRIVKNFPLFIKVVELFKLRFPEIGIEYKCIQNSSREQVRDLMCSADCLLMTSISEGSPQVIKESLSCNLPVVSVPVGDVKELTSGIPSCFTSNSHDADELCNLLYNAIFSRSTSIRELFLKKGIYDNKWVAINLNKEYNK